MVEIIEKSFVVPLEETPKQSIWLSCFDQMALRDYTPTVYLYRPKEGELDILSTAAALKLALSKALVHFYPMAGRLELDGDGRCEIRCTGDGILFVVARSDRSVYEQFGDLTPSPEIRQALIPTVASAEPPAAILAMMQLTFFKCGRVILGVATHHLTVDGTSALHFINTWADIARGSIVDNLPIKPHFDRSLLCARSPPHVLFDHHAEYMPNSNNLTTQKPFSCVILKLFKNQVSQLKISERPLTTFQAVTSLVWRCVCIARGLPADQISRLYITVSIRNRLSPPLPAGFFGNAYCRTSVLASVGEICLSNSINFAAEKIREAIDKVNDDYARSVIDYLDGDKTIWKHNHGSNDLNVISWLTMPVYYANFGWGKPEFLRRASIVCGGKVYLMRNPEDDGGVYVPISLETEIMERFKMVFYRDLGVFSKV